MLIQADADVCAGDTLLVVASMKMETEVAAPKNGQVRSVDVGAADAVQGRPVPDRGTTDPQRHSDRTGQRVGPKSGSQGCLGKPQSPGGV